MRTLLIIFIGLIIFSGCEDIIDIKLDDAPARLVVDAWLNNQEETQTIRLTYSQPYFESNSALPALGAVVKVSSNSGEVFEFSDQGNGDYHWQHAPGQSFGEIDDEFILTIGLGGKNYTAFSKMNRVPEIDEITQELREGELGPDGIYTQFFARDFPGLGDTYWIKTYKNGKFLNKPGEINIAYDAGFDAGAEVDGITFISPIREFTNPFEEVESGETQPSPWAAGDQIRIEIHSINLSAFLFIELARDQILNGDNTIFASPLANTSGNIVNQSDDEEVLGIFNVAAISALEKTID